MFSFSERFLALRFFFSKRKESFISVNVIFSLIGITLGVATLIIVMSVFNGFRKELVARILGINAHITIYSLEKNLSNYDEIIDELEKMPEITKVNTLVDAHGMITKEESATAALVKGISHEDLVRKSLISENILEGNLDNFKLSNAILIGDRLASKLGVTIGDTVTLVAPQINKTIIGLVPRIKDYQIVGVFSVGMHEYDSAAVFIPIKTAQIHFNYKNSVSAIEVMTNDVNNTEEVSNKIFNNLIPNYPIAVSDWQKLNASFMNAVKIERNVMFLILSLIIIVAAFNIISSLIMLVNDKLKHIALLRTMGLTKLSITKIFFINGALIGLIGTTLGAVCGTLFAYNIDSIKRWLESLTGVTLFDPLIYFLTDLPAEVNIFTVILVVIVSLIICFLAAIYPAWKAAKLEPADILRYE